MAFGPSIRLADAENVITGELPSDEPVCGRSPSATASWCSTAGLASARCCPTARGTSSSRCTPRTAQSRTTISASVTSTSSTTSDETARSNVEPGRRSPDPHGTPRDTQWMTEQRPASRQRALFVPLLAVAAVVGFTLGACGGGGDGSALATLTCSHDHETDRRHATRRGRDITSHDRRDHDKRDRDDRSRVDVPAGDELPPSVTTFEP